jgi:hypothetical protein
MEVMYEVEVRTQGIQSHSHSALVRSGPAQEERHTVNTKRDQFTRRIKNLFDPVQQPEPSPSPRGHVAHRVQAESGVAPVYRLTGPS